MTAVEIDDQAPPIPPLPKNYQRSDGEFEFFFGHWMYIKLLIIAKNPFLDEEFPDTNETKNELKKLRAMSKASKQAELKR